MLWYGFLIFLVRIERFEKFKPIILLGNAGLVLEKKITICQAGWQIIMEFTWKKNFCRLFHSSVSWPLHIQEDVHVSSVPLTGCL
ncbi:hypothetical protein METP3_03809 [Methanosarcinales archaeon]|nr:hypothetical protein METP3_03809 [Methanosarcinales archaeon]